MLKFASGKLGLALVLAGFALYLGARYWMATRTLIALDMPISLAKGHVRSEEFNINLASDYYVQIEVEKNGDIEKLECMMWGCYDTPAILKARWVLSGSNGPEVSGEADTINGGSGGFGVVGRVIGHFGTSGGRGKLNVEILSDARVLDAGKPRLKIEAAGTGYNYISTMYERSLITTGVLILVGSSLLFLAHGTRRAEQLPPTEVAAAHGNEPTALSNLRRLPRNELVSGLPSFALLASVVLLLVLIPFWLLVFWKAPAQGLWIFIDKISVSKPVGVAAKPIIIRIDKEGLVFVDGRSVSNEGFSLALKQALGRRPDWVVYLDADPDLSFQVPAAVLNTINELGARAILVTPVTRRDCCLEDTEYTAAKAH